MENNDKSKWINTILSELSSANSEKATRAVEHCGRACVKSSEDYNKVLEAQKLAKDLKDDHQIFEICHRDIYNNKPTLKMKGNKISIEYTECACGMVKEGKVNHPFLCNCTIGYTKQIFETIYDRPIKVDLQKSILRGDNICKLVISI